MVCYLDIYSSPTGAKVYIDGRLIGTTPIDDYKINTGRYSIKITKEGYEDWTYSGYEIKASDLVKWISANLNKIAAKTGGISFKSSPSDAKIYLNEEYKGKTPKTISELNAGRYYWGYRKDGYENEGGSVDVRAGETTTISKTLKALGLPPAKTAISINSEPQGANVFIDGINMNKKTWAEIEVVEGKREIKLTLAGYKDYLKTETITKGSILFVKYILEKIVEKVPSEFEVAWNKLKENISNGNWLAAAGNLLALPFAKIVPADTDILMGEVPITPIPSGIDPSIIAKLGPKLTIWGRITQIFKNLAAAAKANPLIAIFAATEIPQVTVMSIFAFKWLAEQKGESLTSVSISLNNIYSAWEAAGYKFSTAVKNKDFTGAANLLAEMMRLTTEYDNTLLGKKDVLTKAGEYEARAAILDMMKTANEEMKKSVGVTKLPETIKVFVRDITDGDTIETDIKGYDAVTGNEISLPALTGKTHAGIRLVGINAPEKSPKGEILCSEIEIYKVEKKYADYARDVLLPLNDRQVILKIDPEKQLDTYGRILAVVEYDGKDIGLEQIKRGFACWYFREKNKYVNDNLYKEETLKAQRDKKGMWSEVPEEVEKIEVGPIMFSIDSVPTNAKVWIDETYTRHLTPTNETEQKDVIHLWTEGKHKLRLEKSGYAAEQEIELKRGERLTLTLELEGMITVPVIPPVIPEVPVVPEVPIVPVVVPATIQEFFNVIKTYYVGRLYMSKKELRELGTRYGLDISGLE